MRNLVLTLICGVLLASAQFAGAAELSFAPNDDLRRGASSHDRPQRGLSPPVRRRPAVERKDRRVCDFADDGGAQRPRGRTAPHQRLPRPASYQNRGGGGRYSLGQFQAGCSECGPGVEGMSRPGQNAAIFKRLKRIGVDVTYAAIDEPLTWGHFFQGRNACRFSLPTQLDARRGGRRDKESYPNIRVVDYEAPEGPVAQWPSDFDQFLKNYREAAARRWTRWCSTSTRSPIGAKTSRRASRSLGARAAARGSSSPSPDRAFPTRRPSPITSARSRRSTLRNPFRCRRDRELDAASLQ